MLGQRRKRWANKNQHRVNPLSAVLLLDNVLFEVTCDGAQRVKSVNVMGRKGLNQ